MADEPSNPKTFATHVLCGRRFDGHAVPVDVLSELNAYRNLVVAVARGVFFLENRGRQRVPKNFEDGFRLVLRTIDSGSAALPLERVGVSASPVSQLTLALPQSAQPAADYFERARDLISAVVRAVSTGKTVPAEFPQDALPLFNLFGRTLIDGETIEMSAPNQPKAVYNRQVRKKLVLVRAQTYEDAADVVGQVVQFDRQRMAFELLLEGRRIAGRLDELPEDAVRIISTACAQGDQLRVRIMGLGAYDSADRLIRFVKIDDVSYAEDEALKLQLDIGKQLEALAQLPEGWLDGEGASLDRPGLAWLAQVLKRAEAEGLRRPYLYPMPNGHLQAEWSHPDAEVSAEFDVVAHTADVSAVMVRNQATRDETIDLASDAGIERLVKFVTVFGPEGMGGRV
jgi:hypothetical protein